MSQCCVLEHLQGFWPNQEIDTFIWDMGRIVDEMPDFSVCRVNPLLGHGEWIYVSCGIAAVAGFELLIASPTETPIHVQTLAMCASYVLSYPEVNVGSILSIGQGWIEGSSLEHLLVSLPYPFGPKLEYAKDGTRYLWLLPIHADEAQLASSVSQEALEVLFDEHGILYLDINRASVIGSGH